MSTLELKGIVMEKIAALNNEDALKEIIVLLEKLSETEKNDNLSKVRKVYEKAVDQYGNVLQKLAQ